MLNKVLETIKKYNMTEPEDSVTVALSGGADSVALLLVLDKLKDELKISLDACHVNHNLRGEEAKRDENFCIELCKKLNIPINVASVDVISKSKKDKTSTEMAARELRYDALFSFAKGKIATAHTLSDSFETSVFNFTRGTGLKGLSGITPVRNNIIRPLINVSREEIEKFLEENHQTFVNDSTNFENVYSRNKIRNIVAPVLKEINPSLFSTYEKTRETMNYEEDYLDSVTDKALSDAANSDGSLNTAVLLENHTAIRRRMILKYFLSRNAACDYKKICLIEDMLHSGGDVEIKEDIYAHIGQGKLSLLKKEQKNQNTAVIEPEKLNNFTLAFNGKRIGFLDISGEEKKLSVNLGKKAFKNCLNCDKIKSNVEVRTRKDGDSITLAGRNVTKSLKKLFNEEKILPSERDKLIVIEYEKKIIFVEGFGCSKEFAADINTENAVKIEISKL